MNNPRPWIAAFGIIVFLAGSAAGVLVTRATAVTEEGGAFDAFAERLIEEFDLSQARAGHLRVVLREYDADIARIQRAHRASYYASLEAELRPKGIEYNNYIRDKVLPPEHRVRFDKQAEGLRITTDPLTREQ